MACAEIVKKKPAFRGLTRFIASRTDRYQLKNHSHSIIYDVHNQLTGKNFLSADFHRTVLYTVTGNQYHEKCHVTGSVNRTAFHRLVRLRRPGQRTLPTVGFAREIC